MINIRLEEVDRAIFEIIRLAVVAKEWYPDVTTLSSAVELEAAKKTLRDQEIELVEPIGVGSWQSKDEKSISKVVVMRNQIVKDGLGAEGCYFYVKVEDGGSFYYQKYEYPKFQKTINYEIRLICNTAVMERQLIDLIGECFYGGRRELNPILSDGTWDTTRSFRFLHGDIINITAGRIIEWMVPAQAGPLWLEAPRLVQDNIPPFTHIRNDMIMAGIVITPDVHREHEFDAEGKYLLQEGEDFIPIIEK